MKVLFIYFNRYIRPRTQLSLSLLETIVKNAGHDTKIFDTSFYADLIDPSEAYMVKAGIHKKNTGLDIKLKNTDFVEDFIETIKDFSPNLIAFSSYDVDADLHKIFIGASKKNFPEIPVVCGGPVASINPRKCFEGGLVDFVCFGEGENVIVELCERIGNNDRTDNITGLWAIKNGIIIDNGVAPLTDLEKIPFQSWDSYDPAHIYGLFEGRAYRMGHVETMRGCPFNCSYCGSGSIKKSYYNQGIKKYIRYKSAEQIVSECEFLKKKYKLEIFYFTVGTFTAMPIQMMRDLADKYSKRVGVPFIALVHPMTINSEVAELLKKMGCIHASIGIESGVDKFRRDVLNRYMTNDAIIESVGLLRKNGIHVSAYNILGIPGMDREHVFKTIELNRMAKPHSSLVSVLIPFKDAEITKKLIRDGIIREEDINIGTGLFPTIDIKEMTREEIDGLFNTFNLYVKMPKLLFPFIRLLEKNSYITRSVRKFLYWVLGIERSIHLFFLRSKIGVK